MEYVGYCTQNWKKWLLFLYLLLLLLLLFIKRRRDVANVYFAYSIEAYQNLSKSCPMSNVQFLFWYYHVKLPTLSRII